MNDLDEKDYSEELLYFFKALADANRLKIIGLLAQSPLSVEQIAELLKLHSSTVSHHLARLAKVGLVSARAEGYYSVYQLDPKTGRSKPGVSLFFNSPVFTAPSQALH